METKPRSTFDSCRRKRKRGQGGWNAQAMKAAVCGHTAKVTQLHEPGADVNAAASNGLTAVMAAALGGHTSTVTQLHMLGANVKDADNDGVTAVMLVRDSRRCLLVHVRDRSLVGVRESDDRLGIGNSSLPAGECARFSSLPARAASCMCGIGRCGCARIV